MGQWPERRARMAYRDAGADAAARSAILTITTMRITTHIAAESAAMRMHTTAKGK